MTPTWKKMPTTFGWWFFTYRLEDWDLADAVSVSQIEDGQKVTFQANFRRSPIGYTEGPERIVAGRIDVTPTLGWWYGPFRVQRPMTETQL